MLRALARAVAAPLELSALRLDLGASQRASAVRQEQHRASLLPNPSYHVQPEFQGIPLGQLDRRSCRGYIRATMIDSTRRATGRFVKGNPGGPGNPHNKKAGMFRAALYNAVTPEDIEEVVQALLEKAKEGDVAAARELLDRLIGKPEVGGDILEKIELLEGILLKVSQRGRN